MLVLPLETKIDGMVYVAQIHDASELAGPGDFPLTDNYADCFAESWNIWTAFVDTLEYRGMVSQDIAALVAARQGAKRPKIKDGTVEFYFRLQELKTGRFFGKIAQKRERASRPHVTWLKDWNKKRVTDFANYWESQPLAAAAAKEEDVRPSRAYVLRGDDLADGVWVDANVAETCFGDTVLADVTVSLPQEFANARNVVARAFTCSCEEWHVLSAEIEDNKAYISLELSQATWEKVDKQVPRLALQLDQRGVD